MSSRKRESIAVDDESRSVRPKIEETEPPVLVRVRLSQYVLWDHSSQLQLILDQDGR